MIVNFQQQQDWKAKYLKNEEIIQHQAQIISNWQRNYTFLNEKYRKAQVAWEEKKKNLEAVAWFHEKASTMPIIQDSAIIGGPIKEKE